MNTYDMKNYVIEKVKVLFQHTVVYSTFPRDKSVIHMTSCVLTLEIPNNPYNKLHPFFVSHVGVRVICLSN